MPADRADPAPGGTDPDPLFDEVVARLPLAADPEQMERLVVLALRMALRREEDRGEIDRLTRSIHDAIDQARRRSDEGEFNRDLPRIGRECARLLEAARRSRLSRRVVLSPAEQDGPAAPAPRRHRVRRLAPAVMIAIAALLFLPAAAIAIDPALAPASWRSPPAARLTAISLAREIAAVPAGGASQLAGLGIVTHLAALIDDRPLVMIDNVPRRLCPGTAARLARQGEVTIFGRPAPDARPSTLASLCHGGTGAARLMWTPRRPIAVPAPAPR